MTAIYRESRVYGIPLKCILNSNPMKSPLPVTLFPVPRSFLNFSQSMAVVQNLWSIMDERDFTRFAVWDMFQGIIQNCNSLGQIPNRSRIFQHLVLQQHMGHVHYGIRMIVLLARRWNRTPSNWYPLVIWNMTGSDYYVLPVWCRATIWTNIYMLTYLANWALKKIFQWNITWKSNIFYPKMQS